MKKSLFVLFIIGSMFIYSNSKCDITAKKGMERLVQDMRSHGAKRVKYDYIGKDQGSQYLYVYEIEATLNRITNKALVRIDTANGSLYSTQDYPSSGLKPGQNLEFQLLGTGIAHLKCR